MAKYQLEIMRDSYRHFSGAKDYHYIIIDNTFNGMALFWTRFGKADKHGTSNFMLGQIYDAKVAFKNKKQQKDARGYTEQLHSIVGVKTGLPQSAITISGALPFNFNALSEFFSSKEIEDLRAEPLFKELLSDVLTNHVDDVVEPPPSFDYTADPNWGVF